MTEHGKPTLLDLINEYRKAIAGVLVPPLVALGAALLPGSDAGTAVTPAEWVGIVIAGLVTGVVVGAVPNKPPAG